MIYLLDTSIISALYDRKHPYHDLVYEKIKAIDNEQRVIISILTIFEIRYSIACCKDENLKNQLEDSLDLALASFDYTNLTLEDATHFATIKAKIKHRHRISMENMRKLSIDLMLASSAISNEAVFVSTDKVLLQKIQTVDRHFVFENWGQ